MEDLKPQEVEFSRHRIASKSVETELLACSCLSTYHNNKSRSIEKMEKSEVFWSVWCVPGLITCISAFEVPNSPKVSNRLSLLKVKPSSFPSNVKTGGKLGWKYVWPWFVMEKRTPTYTRSLRVRFFGVPSYVIFLYYVFDLWNHFGMYSLNLDLLKCRSEWFGVELNWWGSGQISWATLARRKVRPCGLVRPG